MRNLRGTVKTGGIRRFGIWASLALAGACSFGAADETQSLVFEPAVGVDSTRRLTATIDGVAFDARAFSTQSLTTTRVSASNTYITAADRRTVELYIADVALGTHAIAASFPGRRTYGYLYFDGFLWMSNETRTGTVNITLLTADRIAGTFQFDAGAHLATTSPAARRVINGSFAARRCPSTNIYC
jgi:hypothetical protein